MKFYLCPELNCNRKYKTHDRIVIHLLDVHNVVLQDELTPVEVTKENIKKENDKNRINRIKEIEENNKKANELAQKELIEKYKEIELKRIHQVELELKIKNDKLENEKNMTEYDLMIKKRIIDNGDLCCICYTEMADTALIPCGHRNYCYECAGLLNKQKGCPVCRKAITTISKIFL